MSLRWLSTIAVLGGIALVELLWPRQRYVETKPRG